MNFEVHDLQPLEVAVSQMKEVLKIVMHSIIFQRALGEYGFRDTESELFDVSYVRCNSRLIDLKVEGYAEEFSKALEQRQWGDEKGHVQFCVSFFERREHPGAFGLFRSEEKVTWERWNIPLVVQQPDVHRSQGNSDAERRRRQMDLERCLREQLEFVLTAASLRKEHIPPADRLGGDVPWFEISSSASEVMSGLDMFKQMLSSPPLISTAGRGR